LRRCGKILLRGAMTYDIYFHNDFDGRASAAVMLVFLRSRGDDIKHFTAVDYDIQFQWEDENFFKKHELFSGKRNPAIVVDFSYHPNAAWWFDHHATTFKKREWKKRFKPDAFHVLAPQYLSCCHLVYASLKKNFGWKPPQNISNLVRWADMVDSAKFAAPEQTIFLTGPVLKVDAFIDATRKNRKLAEWMVRQLAEVPLSRIAARPAVGRTVKKVRAENLKALRFYRERMKALGNVTLIDLVHANVTALRFASYYLYPKVQYAVRMTRKGPFYHVGIGANAWLKKRSDVDIGKLAARYGGGGHKGAGAIDFLTEGEARAAIPKIIEQLS
jgi:hypothetical protein